MSDAVIYALIVYEINLYVNDRVLEMTLMMMCVLQFGQFSLKLSPKNGRDSHSRETDVAQKIAATKGPSLYYVSKETGWVGSEDW